MRLQRRRRLWRFGPMFLTLALVAAACGTQTGIAARASSSSPAASRAGSGAVTEPADRTPDESVPSALALVDESAADQPSLTAGPDSSARSVLGHYPMTPVRVKQIARPRHRLRRQAQPRQTTPLRPHRRHRRAARLPRPRVRPVRHGLLHPHHRLHPQHRLSHQQLKQRRRRQQVRHQQHRRQPPQRRQHRHLRPQRRRPKPPPPADRNQLAFPATGSSISRTTLTVTLSTSTTGNRSGTTMADSNVR